MGNEKQTFGRYELLEPLGRGGMAEVYKAKSFGVEGFEKTLVIKRILPKLAKNKAFVDMFIHEAKLAVRLSHANIVQVFDLGKVTDPEQQTDSYFMAMEYVAGLDFATLIRHSKKLDIPLPLNLCVYAASEVAKGLDHAHRRRDEQLRPLGIVHRDVSPQNVLLSWEGEVKVTDFGIAKARGMASKEEGSTVLKGKYAYMSPEQARGEDVDARSDIFSLGTLLYESIGGVNPFSAPTPFETLRRVQAAEFPPLELLVQDIPEQLAQIVHKSLSKNPKDRYESAGKLYEDLLAFMYMSDSRFTANDLATFLGNIRKQVDQGQPTSKLPKAGDLTIEPEHTPVEVPTGRHRPITSSPDGSSGVTGARLAGERREVTAMVITFEQREWSFPQHLRAQIKDTLARYGARLIDEEPSQMVSLFGLGDTDGRDTETAVRCALVLLRQLNVGKVGPSVGVDTGRILLHPSGEPARDSRLSNLVAEAQELARATVERCVVSGAAAVPLRNAFFLEPLNDGGRAMLKPGAMLVGDLRAPEEALGKFVARKAQLRRMGELLALASKRQLRPVTVLGGQGIGKTRFMYEVSRRLRKGQFDVGFYLASCPPRGSEAPLSGLTAMLEVLCGVQEGDNIERILGVEPRLRALGLTDAHRNAVLSQLGAHRTSSEGPKLPQLRAAFTRMVQSLSEDRLHTFVWDNAHALDPESLSVLVNTANKLKNARAVFVLASRTAPDESWQQLPLHDTIKLGELDEEGTEQLIIHRAGLESVPEQLLEFCMTRTGGHPLFVEEVLRELLETGALVVEDGRATTLLISDDLSVPRPLQSLLAARVGRLEDEEKSALYAAIILGDPVENPVLGAMLQATVPQTEKLIDQLVEADLLQRINSATCRIASPMLREAVIETLPSDAVSRLHAAAAEAYSQVFPKQQERFAHRIATHLHEGGQRDAAATFYALAGKQKLHSGQLESAVHDMMRALQLVDMSTRNVNELVGWLETFNHALKAVRSAPAVEDVLMKVVRHVDKNASKEQQVRVRMLIAGMLGSVHMFEDSEKCIGKALESDGLNDNLKLDVLLTAADVLFRRGQFRRSRDFYEQAAKLQVPLDPAQAYRLEIGMAHTLSADGQREESLRHLEIAADLADDTDVAAAVEREKIRGLIYYFTRDFRHAVAAFERCAELARSSSLTYELALALHNMGDTLIWLGSFARSDVAFRESLSICDLYGYERLMSHNRMYLAFLEAEKGSDSSASLLEGLIRQAEHNGYIWDVLDGRHLLGTLAFRRGDMDIARRELALVRDGARENNNQLLRQSAEEMLAQLQEAEGFQLTSDPPPPVTASSSDPESTEQ